MDCLREVCWWFDLWVGVSAEVFEGALIVCGGFDRLCTVGFAFDCCIGSLGKLELLGFPRVDCIIGLVMVIVFVCCAWRATCGVGCFVLRFVTAGGLRDFRYTQVYL